MPYIAEVRRVDLQMLNTGMARVIESYLDQASNTSEISPFETA
jgi:hypothetical protein